jgi:hypothetical protein
MRRFRWIDIHGEQGGGSEHNAADRNHEFGASVVDLVFSREKAGEEPAR